MEGGRAQVRKDLGREGFRIHNDEFHAPFDQIFTTAVDSKSLRTHPDIDGLLDEPIRSENPCHFRNLNRLTLEGNAVTPWRN